MLIELYIKNLAVIKETRIAFEPGLTVISGDEGAGKSLIVDALSLLLGGRASTTLIRSGATTALVEGLFQAPSNDENLASVLQEAGIEIDADATLILSREVHGQGRSIARVNGRPVPVSLLRELGQRLMDIYSQMEHLSLLNPQHQLDMLDGYAGLLESRHHLATRVSALHEKVHELNTLARDDAGERRELLERQISEIQGANLQPGEDEALQRERQILQQAQTLKEECYAAYAMLYADDRSAASMVHHAHRAVQGMLSIDPALRQHLEALESARAELEQTARELRLYADKVVSHPDRLVQIEERMELLRHLQSKYRLSLEDVIEFADRSESELESLQAQEEQQRLLEEQRLELEKEVAEQALELSKSRQTTAHDLTRAVNEELAHLGMPWAKFDIHLKQVKQNEGLLTPEGTYLYTEHGIDRIEFLAATNPGEPLKPLTEIASGGETCRFMLALKSALRCSDPVPLLVFDEIDIGMGGRNAHIVGKRLEALASKRQVLCITHLPQIACFAQHHFRVLKDVASGQAVTRVERLKEGAIVEELAVMLGSQANEHMLQSAEALLKRARGEKQELVAVCA